MDYDYSELRGKIYAKYRSLSRFAREMGVSSSTMTNRLDCIKPFTAPEIEKSMKLLGLPMNQLEFYFFTHKEEKQ